MDFEKRKRLVNDLVQMKISLSWMKYYGEIYECQVILDAIRILSLGDLTSTLSPYLIANYFLALLRLRPTITTLIETASRNG